MVADMFGREFLGVAVQAWLILLVLWAGITVVLASARKFLIWRVGKLVRRTKTTLDDVVLSLLKQTKLYFLLALSIFLAVRIAPVTDQMSVYISRVAYVVLLIQVIAWGNQLITDWIDRYKERRLEEDAAAVTSMQAVGFVIRLAVYSIIFLIALDNFGVDVTTLIAGLGVGGIAVALALQNILGDLFASLSIVLDKPFVVGDFLIIGDFLGTVEDVGLKTTRLRSLSGEQLVFSNTDLLNSRIRNFKRMYERRIVFSFGVTYDTPYEVLTDIPDTVKKMVESQENTRFDRAHFKEYGDFSLNFEVVYFVLVPDYNVYMDVQQAINLALYKDFDEKGIDFAFPTQTIHVSQLDADSNERFDT
ncbi:MAG: mechanosensitive ion channel family protein [Rhodothermales bacterium]